MMDKLEEQSVTSKSSDSTNHDSHAIRLVLSSLRLSILEGSFANVFGNLTGSVFLPAFSLALGAGPFEMGVIAAIPLVSSAGQFGGSYLVEKIKKTKPIVVTTAFISRNLWLPFTIFSVLFAVKDPVLVLEVLMITLVFYHFFGAVLGVSWFSWMSSIVPDQIRGRYFGLRNIILGGIGLLFVLLGGYFLDWYMEMFPADNRYHAFHILFGIAVLFGLVSTLLLMKQPDLYKPSPIQHSFVSLFKKPLADINFMKLIRFGILWSFSFNIAAPFFIVFMLQDLKLSYTLVAGYAISASCMDILGMWIWGYISDHTANKPVIVISGSILALLPVAWLLVDLNPFSILFFIPFLHVTGGFFGAGFNLCSVNMLLRVAPRENISVYISYWNGFNVITTGLGALLGGLLAKISSPLVTPSLLIFNSSYKYVFLISFVLRIGAVFFLRGLREPKGVAVVKVIQSLRAMQLWVPLWFFLPRPQPENLRSPYWPIWKSSRKIRPDEK